METGPVSFYVSSRRLRPPPPHGHGLVSQILIVVYHHCGPFECSWKVIKTCDIIFFGCKDLEKTVENPDLKLDLDLVESKHGHERGHYITDFDDFSVVEELRVRAFQQHQNHQNRLGTDPVQGLVLIWIQVQVQVQVHIFSGPCNQGKKLSNNLDGLLKDTIFAEIGPNQVIAVLWTNLGQKMCRWNAEIETDRSVFLACVRIDCGYDVLLSRPENGKRPLPIGPGNSSSL